MIRVQKTMSSDWSETLAKYTSLCYQAANGEVSWERPLAESWNLMKLARTEELERYVLTEQNAILRHLNKK